VSDISFTSGIGVSAIGLLNHFLLVLIIISENFTRGASHSKIDTDLLRMVFDNLTLDISISVSRENFSIHSTLTVLINSGHRILGIIINSLGNKNISIGNHVRETEFSITIGQIDSAGFFGK